MTQTADGGRLVLQDHLKRQIEFSQSTFGPGARTVGVVDHIRKELIEVTESNGDPEEWTDVVILALDGLTREYVSRGYSPAEAALKAVESITYKQTKNEGRTWPDWRDADPSKAIEHDRSGEVQS